MDEFAPNCLGNQTCTSDIISTCKTFLDLFCIIFKLEPERGCFLSCRFTNLRDVFLNTLGIVIIFFFFK